MKVFLVEELLIKRRLRQMGKTIGTGIKEFLTFLFFSAMIEKVKCGAKEEYTSHPVREKSPSAERLFQKGFVEGSFQTALLNRCCSQ